MGGYDLLFNWIYKCATKTFLCITENEIYKMIYNYSKQSVVLLVSHRIKSTNFCQQVVVLDNGSVVELGSPMELMQKKGLYYEMYKKECC